MSQQPKPKKSNPAARTAKGVLRTLGSLLATMMMVGIITGCIFACALTVYVLNSIGSEAEIDLDSDAIKLGYTSVIYRYDNETGEAVPMHYLYKSDGNRFWVDYEEINEYTKEAMIAIEDKRFWDHQGVDWIRTTGAFISQLAPGTVKGGGSTIHQQLIKNITGDDDIRVDRKVREIFRALNLAKRYSHEQVLETYLNVVSFGAGTNGIQSAAKTYFNKDAIDLTLAESAAIVGITQYPGYYNPFLYPENNKNRQLLVLFEMHDQGRITDEQYEAAKVEPLNFVQQDQRYNSQDTVQSYFVDHVIEQVIADLMEKYDYTRTFATQQLYEAGYHIYTTVDIDIQNHLEDVFSTEDNFPTVSRTEYPQSASVILDPNGKILGLVGGIGEKTGDRVFNRATMAKRHPGSSIKPIGVYALAFEYNRVRWSTIVDDYPTNHDKPNEPLYMYPRNYYGTYYRNITVCYAIQQSVNTIAIKLAQELTPRTVFDFLHDELGLYNLIESQVENGQVLSDVDLSPMALGGLTEGVTPLEMAGAYQMFVNGGTFTKPYCYYEVRDSAEGGNLILKPDTTPRQVISEDTSVVLNKLLQRVVTHGTGTRARLDNMPTGGKTGTSNDDVDQWFIGFSPYYICQVWLGYDEQITYNSYGNPVKNSVSYAGVTYPPPVLFKTIMQPLHEGLEYKAFLESENVASRTYCTVTGNLAGSNCTSVDTGWYKLNGTGLPPVCDGRHALAEEEKERQQTERGSGTTSGGGDLASETQSPPTAPLVVDD